MACSAPEPLMACASSLIHCLCASLHSRMSSETGLATQKRERVFVSSLRAKQTKPFGKDGFYPFYLTEGWS